MFARDYEIPLDGRTDLPEGEYFIILPTGATGRAIKNPPQKGETPKLKILATILD